MAKSLKLFGLKTCDTCRKALKELESSGKAVAFCDVSVDAPSKAQLTKWAKTAGWDTLLNTRSTTWRGLSAAEKTDISEKEAILLMAQYPKLIKRPVIESNGKVYVSWSGAVREALLD